MVITLSEQQAIEVHRRVRASLLDLLEQWLRQGDERALVEDALTGLLDFTLAHFIAEEEIMRQEGYPEERAHFAEHALLLDTLRRIQATHTAGSSIGPQCAAELRARLADHVQRMDAAFLDWSRARAATSS